MQALACVFFKMQPSDADPLGVGAAGDGNLDGAKFRQRPVILRDLVSLGQIRVEIVLASENRSLIDAAAQCHGGKGGELDRFSIQYRQRARHSQADGAHVGVWWIAEASRAGAENLRGRQ